MREFDKLTNYLILLGFELRPCCMPLNEWESVKMDYYAVFPIKYLPERPDKSIWFSYKRDSNTVIELEFKPISFIINPNNGIKTINSTTEYLFSAYIDLGRWSDIVRENNFREIVSSEDQLINLVESKLGEIDFLKVKIRDYKLSTLLNG